MSIGYAAREELNSGRVYDCNLCPHVSPDLDLARAHYAVHVAAPDLLDSAKKAVAWKILGSPSSTYDADMIFIRAAIAKAEPKGA